MKATIGLLLTILGLWGVSIWVLALVFPLLAHRGSFGDSFGAVNSLFSGLALASVAVAIYLQMQELVLQRKELELTRSELAGQRQQLESQSDTFQQQTFDSTFFQMVTLHHQIVDAVATQRMLYGNTHEAGAVGRRAFVLFYNRFKSDYPSWFLRHPGAPLDQINGAYEQAYASFHSDAGHYFRNLYNIMKLIHRKAPGDKVFYANIVRAQLSSDELLLLFYNCLSRLGREKFKPLVEEYGLLKTVPVATLIQPDHVRLYAAAAYGGAYPTAKPQ